ncbi:hypothetical protein MTO96_005755 [Rhipicephalus appendiculatus]
MRHGSGLSLRSAPSRSLFDSTLVRYTAKASRVFMPPPQRSLHLVESPIDTRRAKHNASAEGCRAHAGSRKCGQAGNNAPGVGSCQINREAVEP